MNSDKVTFSGKVYGWYREVQNLHHDTMKHMETETSQGNFPLQYLAKKIRLRQEQELDHDTCYLAKEEVKEKRMKENLRDKKLASLLYLGLSFF